MNLIYDKREKNTNHHRKSALRVAKAFCIMLVLCLCVSICAVMTYAEETDVNASYEQGLADENETENINEEQNEENGTGDVNTVLPADGYSAVLYNNMNGLPTSEANDIIQASDGFIWIGCYGGLVRYDGNTFERMDRTVGINGVRSLFEDSKNRLWIGSTDTGVIMMERGEYRHWEKEGNLSTTAVLSIAEDNNGLIYIGTLDGIGVIDENLEMKPMTDKRLAGQNIYELKKGADGLIYGLTHNGDIFTLRGDKVEGYISNSNNALIFGGSVQSILPVPDEEGKLIAAAAGKLFKGTFKSGFADKISSDVSPLGSVLHIEGVDKNIWICAVNGVGLTKYELNMLKVLDDIPMSNSFGHVMRDYQKNFWFTSSRQGVMKLVGNQFKDMNNLWGLANTVVNTTCIQNETLYIGTDTGLDVVGDGGIFEKLELKTDGQKGEETVDLIELYQSTRIRSIIVDSKDCMWIADWGKYGLSYIKDGELSFVEGLRNTQVRNVCETKDGRYAASINGGLVLIENGKVVRRYDDKDGITNLDSLNVACAENGDLLLGTDGGGLFVINGDSVTNIGKNDGLTSGIVMRIKYDSKDNIYWIITGNSIAYMTSDYKVKTVTTMPYSNNFDIFRSSKDEMWILSGDGIYVIPVQDMLSDSIKNFNHYAITDGLPYIATANSYSELKYGTLLIAGNNGITLIDIENFINDNKNMKMTIPFVDADGERIYPDESNNFRLSSNVKKLTIYSYVFNYSLIIPQVSYCLEGFDNEYITVSRNNLTHVDYTNLAGGEYNFVLKILGVNEAEDKTVSVRIIKEKAITEQAWFYLLIIAVNIIIVFLIIYFIMHFRLKRLKAKHKEEVERERISTELQTASNIQTGMLPSVFPPFPDRKEFDLYASMDPAKEVGGDFYDFFLIDDDHLCLVIADVSGKGVPAALVMMAAKIVIADFAKMKNSPEDILFAANDSLCENNSEEMFVTAWLGILEISTGKLTAANAGHEYPALMKPDGKFELIKDRRSLVLGGMPGTKYHNYELVLEPGSKLFVYTDGVPEATNASEELFEFDRMVDALNRDTKAEPEQILKNVRTAVDEFVMDAEQFDDLTMLCIEYKGGAENKKTEAKKAEN